MSISKILFTTVLTLLVVVPFASARTWTATSGHQISGDFVELKDGIVAIRLPDGRTADVPLAQLCDDDKEFVEQETAKKDNPFVIRQALPTPQTLPDHAAPADGKQDNTQKIGKDTPFDVLKAEAEQNNPDALCWLALAYSSGLNKCAIDKTKMEECLEKAAGLADSGSAAVLFCRGVCAFHGYGVAENQEEAVKLFRQAAALNFAPAQEQLGMCLLEGMGIPKNETVGIEWVRKAAEQDFAPAQFLLGFCYSAGIGVEEDEKESIQWHQKAADNGDVAAQKYIGTAHLIGLAHLHKNQDEALNWMKKAARQGDTEAIEIVERFEEVENEQIEQTQPQTAPVEQKAEKIAEETVPDRRIPAVVVRDIPNEAPARATPEAPVQDIPPDLDRPFVEIKVGDEGRVSEFSPDSRLLATFDYKGGGGARTVSTIWETATGKKVFELRAGSPSFSLDGRYIVAGYQDWETRKYQERLQRERARGNVPRGAVPMSFLWVKVFDTRTGRELYELEMENAAIDFSADGSAIMFDGYLWNLANGRRLRRLSDAEQKSIEWKPGDFSDERFKHASPDGKWICLEQEREKRLLLQDKGSGKFLYKLENAVEPHWSPNGRFLLHHVTDDGPFRSTDIIRIYDLRPNDAANVALAQPQQTGVSRTVQPTVPQRQNPGSGINPANLGQNVNRGLLIYDAVRRIAR